MKQPMLKHKSAAKAWLGAALCLAALAFVPSAQAETALSTEDFLNRLGVNTHLNGLTKADPWNVDARQVGGQLAYLGVRLDRDWAWSMADGKTWQAVQAAWSPLGRFWTSVDEASPANQRKDLGFEEAIAQTYPHLVYAMGGPNEEDNSYPQSQGATLPDAALVQKSLYDWAHLAGRALPVSQMEFGAGWTAANNWHGDYDPQHTGLNQPYTPGPADFGGAHTYLSNPNQRPKDVLDQIRALAQFTTPGRPVAHTEFGAYTGANLSPAQFGQYLVAGALDSAAAGDAGYLVYGLQDSGPEGTAGFFAFPSGAAHPAATYFHTLTTLLASVRGRYGPGQPSSFRPGALAVSVSLPSASHLLLQKPTGDYALAVWTEPSRAAKPQTETAIVHFGRAFNTVRLYDVENGLAPLATLHKASQCALPMTPNDAYLIVLGQ